MDDQMEDKTIIGLTRFSGNVIADHSLLSALLVGLVRRNILTAEDARDIINRAVQVSDGFYGTQGMQNDIQGSALREARARLLSLLEHAVIKEPVSK